MKKIFTVLLILLQFSVLINLNAQTDFPKREFRAAWISTVVNIDWPPAPGTPPDVAKAKLIEILDYLKAVNLNAVVFQVRPACDAMYASEIEPWSYWLTGLQGKAPNPFWDPLEFAVEEAHKRGMELHAWFNPYRVKYGSWNISLDEKNVAVQHPDWVLTINGDKILDPGLPQVREHVTNVIMDVVRRYDVDAIHFDDYFYLSGITNEDAETFANYNRGFTDLGDWRRDNVHELLRGIYAAIQEEDPYVKFGQSPRGIWRNNVPEGIFGSDNYSSIYCDAVTWLDEQIIDYLAPQLYWQFDGGQDYGKLAPWWGSVRNGRHIYPGLAYYRVCNGQFDDTQIGRMVRLNRSDDNLHGEVYFTANNFNSNCKGINDTLVGDLYRHKAIVPSMDWKDQTPPGAPSNLRYDRVAGTGTNGLTWDLPADTDLGWYALYVFDDTTGIDNKLDDPAYIFDVSGRPFFHVDDSFPEGTKYYAVTALDRNHNESGRSNIFEYQPVFFAPETPALLLPLAGNDEITDTMQFSWNFANHAASYTLEISEDESFSSLTYSESGIIDTSLKVTSLAGETTFFWRVKSVNPIGESDYSISRSFTTAFPAAPLLSSPPDVTGEIAIAPLFEWESRDDALFYQFTLYEGRSINHQALLIDTILTDASYQSHELKPGTFYIWRVNVTNEYGASLWPEAFQFKTLDITPGIPLAISPAEGQNDIGRSVELVWTSAEYALSYRLQVSKFEDFSSFIFNAELTDTFETVDGLQGLTLYYWRTYSINNSGNSGLSEVSYFETGFPVAPQPIYPGDLALNISVAPKFTWSASDVAEQFQFQMSKGVSVNPDNLVADAFISDSTFLSDTLDQNTVYTWRVRGINSIDTGEWSSEYKFKTIEVTSTEEEEIPREFALHQNYPNPFNPSTVIRFDLPERAMTTLKVYNLLGETVAVLIDEELIPGQYSIRFNTANRGMSSGVYLYVLRSGDKTIINKMMLIK